MRPEGRLNLPDRLVVTVLIVPTARSSERGRASRP